MLASTEPVSREINPLIKGRLVLCDIAEDQRMELRVKDIGLMTSEHFGGRLGPMIVAKCSFPVGEDVSGWLELVPAVEVPRNGPPLVQLTARFRRVGALLGNTSALVEVFDQPGSGVPGSVELQVPQALSEQAMWGAAAEPGRSSYAIWYTFMTPNNIAWAKSARRNHRHPIGVKLPRRSLRMDTNSVCLQWHSTSKPSQST